MKRPLLLLVALALVVAGVGALSEDFQTVGYLNNIGCYGTGTGTCTWVQSAVGGNSYIDTTAQLYNYHGFRNLYPSQTTYAAATLLSSTVYFGVSLYDASGTPIYQNNIGNFGTVSPVRVEVQVTGGKAYIYENGILAVTSGTLTTNPSYIMFGPASDGTTTSFDDFIYGSSENRYIFGNPESNVYILKRDMINTAATGLAFANGTVVNSNNMTTTWGRSNITYAGNETIVLENVDTGTIYGTRYTGTASAGTVSWALADEIFNSGAPYGRYYVTIPGSNSYSEEIWYLGSGATISFNQNTYSQQDLATMTYSIDGAYWDTSTYSYSIDVISGTTGSTVHSQAITASSGTDTYTFTSTDPQGVYYAVVKATPNAGGDAIWMNYDYATLSAYLTLTGYVNNETAMVLSGANVNITQNSVVTSQITTADGNYTATGFLTGSPVVINVTKSGYHQYYVQFTPMVAKSIPLNITLNSTTPSYTGLGIGGVIRDGIFDGTTITKGYGRPIQSATAHARNTTFGDSCTNVSNMAGWYKFDESNGCILTSGRLYNVWSEKTGYSGGNYTVVAA